MCFTFDGKVKELKLWPHALINSLTAHNGGRASSVTVCERQTERREVAFKKGEVMPPKVVITDVVVADQFV